MERFWIDIGLCLMLYFILIYIIKMKTPKTDVDNGDDDDGGLPIDLNFDPTLDLPPGITLPVNDDPKSERILEEEFA